MIVTLDNTPSHHLVNNWEMVPANAIWILLFHFNYCNKCRTYKSFCIRLINERRRFASSEIPCHDRIDHRFESSYSSLSTPSSFKLLRRARLTTRGENALYFQTRRANTSRPMWKAGGSSFNSTLHLGNDGPPSEELTWYTGRPENVARLDRDIVSVGRRRMSRSIVLL